MLLALGAGVLGSSAHAEDDKPLSFAFASQAGSGVYSIEGRLIQVYRVPVSVPVTRLDEDRIWGVAVTLPVTFGFYDFEPADVLSGEFPSHVGTASLLPGVEFDVRVNDHWVLSPHVDAGVAKDFSGGSLVWVYDTGARSNVTFPVGSWDARAGQEVLWAGASHPDDALSDWYGEAKVAFEFRHTLPWSSRASTWDAGLFVAYQRFFKKKTSEAVAYSAPAATPGVDEQTEIGFTIGTRPKLAWKKLSMPELGASYKFGDGIRGVRIIIGAAF